MTRAEDLLQLLREETSLGIICHTNPDPDCLASAFALQQIAYESGIPQTDIVYSGTISHPQNQALVSHLDLDLVPLSSTRLSTYDLLAFVDHSVAGINNDVPPGTPIDIVIDHHPNEPTDAQFVDQQVAVGASATILTEYIHDLDIELDFALATALLFAIRRETLGFVRGTTPAEYAAAQYLHPHADHQLLQSLVHQPISVATVNALSDAITNRVVEQTCLVSHIGWTPERDTLPQTADYLLDLEGIQTTVISGIVDDAVQVSARSRSPHHHLGMVLQEAFSDLGSAGGHSEMAGSCIPLDQLPNPSVAHENSPASAIGQLIIKRVLEALGIGPQRADKQLTEL